jgi:uncharacterized protein (DUF924 family)
MADPIDVLDFWLGEVGPDGWYKGGDDLDATCRARFLEVWQAARDGGLEHWVVGTVGTLAYLVVCDQLARNIHRGHADAFATDVQARAAARLALEKGWDIAAPEPERQFFYMPFMHSEDLADQALCVQLFIDKMPETGADQVIHARAHEAIIARFGRFPFRNKALGRESSPEEDKFIADGAYGAIVEAIKASHAASA